MEIDVEHLYHKIEIIINKGDLVNSEVEIEDHLIEDQDKIEGIDKIKAIIILIEENSNDDEDQQFMSNE
jgi:hypothetical protein